MPYSTPARLARTNAAPARLTTGRRSSGLRGVVTGVFLTATAMAFPSVRVCRSRLLDPAGIILAPTDRQPRAPDRKHQQGRSDSNAQPAVLETAALPIELHPFFVTR